MGINTTGPPAQMGRTRAATLPRQAWRQRHPMQPEPVLSGSTMVDPRRRSWYRRFTRLIARQSGRPQAFTGAVTLVGLWLLTGPLFGFSDTWQLVINTATTIITFLMVFVIQNTQNRDTEALQIKLDELIRVTQGASDSLMDLEEMAEQQLDHLHEHYETLAQLARQNLADPPD